MALEVQRPFLDTDRSECQFAFRRIYQAREIICSLRHLVKKFCDYRDPPLVVVGCDTRKFYAYIRHPLLAQRLDEHGVSRVASSFWIRGARNSAARIRLPGNPLTKR
eukprot:1820417-Pyramimonas_sp.AAC.1